MCWQTRRHGPPNWVERYLRDAINVAAYQSSPAKARALANQVDTMLWQEGFNLPLYQFPGNVAVQSDLADYGAFGLGDIYWPAIGSIRN